MDVNFNEEELEQLYLCDAITNDFQNSIVSRAYRAFDSHDTALRKFLFRYPKNPVLWVMFYTGNVSVRRVDMVKIGMFDEKFFGWGIEDLEIGYRFQKEGIKIIRGSNITNFHLTHDYDPVQRMREASRNINYFLRKSRRDFLVKAILYMLKFTILLRILHRNLLKKNSKEGIRYARKA
jgi:GT2 family glycosyltransferase